MRQEFYYPSAGQATKIHAVEWIPDNEAKAVLQICHGMVEYIERYDGFASYMNTLGFYVVGHDHLGHGKSIQSQDDYGHFPYKDGNHHVINDIQRLRKLTAKKYPDVPYFMMGHSMGSFLLRQYLMIYGQGLSGAIIMGTGYKNGAILTAGQILCKAIASVKGWNYRSKLVNQLGMGGYNKQFEPSNSTKDWISSDDEMRIAYENDPLCSFVFTVGGYYQMFKGMKTLARRQAVKRIPKELPVFLVAGQEDPVGDCGKAVRKVYRKYKKAGMDDVKLKLYPGDRHEILNEQDREQVYKDLGQWLYKHTK